MFLRLQALRNFLLSKPLSAFSILFSTTIPQRFKDFIIAENSGTNDTQNLGYNEVKAEILAKPDTARFPEIDTFVLSINEKYVEERMKNANKFILFVEYGDVNLNPTIANGTKQTLSITVAKSFPQNNNDNLNEVLIMNKCLSILNQIIEKLNADQQAHDFCANMELIISELKKSDIYFHTSSGLMENITPLRQQSLEKMVAEIQKLA